MEFPITFLKSGETAEIANLHGEPGWVGRLAELGLIAGKKIRMLQPGATFLLDLGDSRVSLGIPASGEILVRQLPL
ncbi:MAG: ferrous iron transport protein A [Gemmataceae bacterium]|nr:ferrous iron transport protein A [Gemmataceae bacterium]